MEDPLFQYLSDRAQEEKTQEAGDPKRFLRTVSDHLPKVADCIRTKKTLTVSSLGVSTPTMEPGPGLTGLQAVFSFLHTWHIESEKWGDDFWTSTCVVLAWSAVTDQHAVVLSYSTPGALTVDLAYDARFQQLVQQARSTPGLPERVRNQLVGKGIVWDAFDSSGAVSTTIEIAAEECGRWAIAVDMHKLYTEVANHARHVQLRTTKDVDPAWWTDATTSRTIPSALLPLIRGRETTTVVPQNEVYDILDWSNSLGKPVDGGAPFIITNVSPTDIIGDKQCPRRT